MAAEPQPPHRETFPYEHPAVHLFLRAYRLGQSHYISLHSQLPGTPASLLHLLSRSYQPDLSHYISPSFHRSPAASRHAGVRGQRKYRREKPHQPQHRHGRALSLQHLHLCQFSHSSSTVAQSTTDHAEEQATDVPTLTFHRKTQEDAFRHRCQRLASEPHHLQRMCQSRVHEDHLREDRGWTYSKQHQRACRSRVHVVRLPEARTPTYSK